MAISPYRDSGQQRFESSIPHSPPAWRVRYGACFAILATLIAHALVAVLCMTAAPKQRTTRVRPPPEMAHRHATPGSLDEPPPNHDFGMCSLCCPMEAYEPCNPWGSHERAVAPRD